ncbi:MAG TPA: hypothetical protein VFA81_02220 [Burkholderiales bacterium]|nr:hypothetical protein [Burkholderiales bacterium]
MNATLISLGIMSLVWTSSGFAQPDAQHDLDISKQRVAIVVGAGDKVETVEAVRDYFMDRGASVHVLTSRSAASFRLPVCRNEIDIVPLIDSDGRQRPIAIYHWTEEASVQAYDLVYATHLGEAQAAAFLQQVREARRPVLAVDGASSWTAPSSISVVSR